MRAASSYDHKLMEVMMPVIKDIRDRYDNGQYSDCIKAVHYCPRKSVNKSLKSQ